MKWKQHYCVCSGKMSANVKKFLENLEGKGFDIKIQKRQKNKWNGSKEDYYTYNAQRDGLSFRGDCSWESGLHFDSDLFYKVDTGGYEKYPRYKSSPKGWSQRSQTTLNDKMAFVDQYKPPTERKDIENRYGFEPSQIITENGYSRWGDAFAFVKVVKLVAIQGISISNEYINIPENDIWYLCVGSGRYGSLRVAVNIDTTIWIPVHANRFGMDDEVLRQTRTTKGKLTINDQKLITEAIRIYNARKLTQER